MRRLFLLAALLAAAPLRAQDSTVTRSTTIGYLTSVTAYVNAGREDGLAAGSTLEVWRAGAAIGVLTVTDVSSHRAACTITRADQPLAVGDSARYRPVQAPVTEIAIGGPSPRPASRKGPPAIRGRVGVRYLYSRSTKGDQTLSVPAVDLRLDGANLGGSGIGLAVDIRQRWTSQSAGAGAISTTEGLTRVFQAALIFEPVGGPVRAVVGRQMSPTLASIAFLDGALVEARGRSWAVGAVAGTEPDPATFSPSSQVKDVGGYLQFRSPIGGGAKRWTATIGAMGSYTDGHSNREFGYVQGGYMDSRFSVFAAQEIDYYAPWKVAAGEPHAVSFTSTYSNVRWRIANPITIAGGYDNRRNVRLYRDVVNPETDFDDAYRQGVYGSILVNPGRQLQFGLEARNGSGGGEGKAASYTATAGVYGISRLGMSVRARATSYTNPSSDGWLGVLALSMSPGARLSLELNGGFRTENSPVEVPASRSLYWVGGYADLAVLRALYLMLSLNHEDGSIEGADRGYIGVSYRF